MKDFFDDSVLLKNKTAEELYKNFAKNQPIIDYHCHLSPKEIYENKRFNNIGELWLAGDHYKWRAMRQNGIDEKLITGDADYKDKFIAFASTMEYAAGNPLYYWSHMELKQLFGINIPLNVKNAERIWNEANERMAQGGFSSQELIKRCDVRVICTTDDPADDLEYHKLMLGKTYAKVLPTFRPDIICYGLNRDDILPYIKKLGASENTEINDFAALLTVLEKRLDYFCSLGCKVADHALGYIPPEKGEYEDAKEVFARVLDGNKIPQKDLDKYTDFMTRFFATLYYKRDMVMQVHMAPLRNVNSKLFSLVGADSGIDVVGDPIKAVDFARMLDEINKEAGLPKMVFYCLNATVNDMIAAMTGAFSESVPGKMQLGSAWWFNDHVDGIRAQLHSLANAGLLGRFIGMLTDSRSFTSYVRFDFFRRILCSEIGAYIENGEFDPDCGKIIEGISYKNAKDYFGF